MSCGELAVTGEEKVCVSRMSGQGGRRVYKNRTKAQSGAT